MKKIYLLTLIFFLANNIYAQNCNSNTTNVASYTAKNTEDLELVTNFIYAGEYVTVTNILEEKYTFTSTYLGSNDFITIRNASGSEVLAESVSPLTYTFQSADIPTGEIRVIIHLSDSCDGDDNTHTVNLQKVPTCYKPEDPRVSYLSNTRLDFYWSAPSTGPSPLDYDWEIGPTGFTPGTGSDVVKGSIGGLLEASSGENALMANTNYQVAIRSNCGSENYSNWLITPNITTLSADPPSNDLCSGATLIIQETGKAIDGSDATAVPGSVLGGAGTNEDAEICNAKSANARDDVWYRFLAQTTDINIALDPIFDGRLSLFSGDCNTLSLLDCSDDNGGLSPTTEAINFNNLTIGQTYYFRVYSQGFSATNPNFTVKLWSSTATTDADGDGYSNNPAVDCNDGNASIFPGAEEICDGLDNNCDGQVDEGLTFTTYYADSDGDGFGNPNVSEFVCDGPSAGYVINNTDCDDDDPDVNPDATEIPDNGKDDDCNPSTLDSSADVDDDGDGFSENQGDCDDTKNNIYPGATEVPDNNIDEDCDGSDIKTWFRDADDDGYGDVNQTTLANTTPSGYVANSTDCNDNTNTINPAATEVVANGIDENCDGLYQWYQDNDDDNYGSLTIIQSNNSSPGLGESDNALDCNDSNASINPEATDIVANGIDENCDGLYQWYLDSDEDGYGSSTVVESVNSSPGSGESNNNSDCNDGNDTIYPGAPEICDGLDNDCGNGVPNTEVDSDSDGVLDCEDNCPEVSNPGQEDSNGNGIGDACESLSVQATSLLKNILIEPNPFQSSFNVHVQQKVNNQKIGITLFDLNGRLIYNNSHTNDNGMIRINDFTHLQKGIYFLKISSDSEFTIKQIIKL
ncbi:MopE-related protein [Tamlana flava]|uniref:MopE-related protein n=1 Tax=Tamlana flava TaxID=3158572 RepID=UPI00351B491A